MDFKEISYRIEEKYNFIFEFDSKQDLLYYYEEVDGVDYMWYLHAFAGYIKATYEIYVKSNRLIFSCEQLISSKYDLEKFYDQINIINKKASRYIN